MFGLHLASSWMLHRQQWSHLCTFTCVRSVTLTWLAFFGHDMLKATHLLSNMRQDRVLLLNSIVDWNLYETFGILLHPLAVYRHRTAKSIKRHMTKSKRACYKARLGQTWVLKVWQSLSWSIVDAFCIASTRCRPDFFEDRETESIKKCPGSSWLCSLQNGIYQVVFLQNDWDGTWWH